MKNVIIFGSAEWDFLYQRSRALAEELSELGYQVYFFEPLLPIAKRLMRLFQGKKRTPQGQTNKPHNLKIIEWSCPTAFRGTISPGVDKQYFSFKFKRFLRANDIKEASLIIAMPFWYDGLLSRNYSKNPNFKVIYDCIDELSVFARNKKILARLIKREAKLVEDCQLVVCTANVLIDYIRGLKPGAAITHIPNGVGLKHFLSERNKAAALKKIKSPIVGFVGGIYNWVDIELIEYASEKLPDVSFVLVGPSKGVDLSKIKERENVCLIGPVEYRTVPSYVNAFDVCIIPFKLNDIIQSTDPIKIYEYFSLEKPVVVTDFPEARKYQDILYIARSKEDFVAKVQEAINEAKSEGLNSRRYEVAFNASWRKRAESIIEIL